MDSASGGKPNARIVLRPPIDPEDLPGLPEINNPELQAQVFTHRSYFARPTHVFEDALDDPSPDNEMLEHLGDSVLSLVVTALLREVYPTLRVGPSTKIRALVVGNPTLASIAVLYNLHGRLLTHPAQTITLRASTNIQADLFESYVGGLYLDGGLEVARKWLCPLLRPYIVEAYRIVRIQHDLPPEPVPITPHRFAPRFPSITPTWSTPGHSRIAASIGHLSLFNQHMQQRATPIEWVYTDSAGEGSKTTPIWVVRAMVNGECLGRGRGSNKKAARDQAAKEGLEKLGVTLPRIGVFRAQHTLSRLGPDVTILRGWSSRPGVKRLCMKLLSRIFPGQLRKPPKR